MGQINLSGSVGVPGNIPVLGSFDVIFASNANHTLTATEFSNQYLNVVSGVTLTSTLQLIAPLTKGQTFIIQNNTNGGQAITVIGSSGAGVTVNNGSTALVVCDGTNYISPTASAGSGSITMSGDVTGQSNTNKVVQIQGVPVSNAIPTNGQILEYNSSAGKYIPVTLSSSGISWTGDMLGSNDSTQYVASISGQGGTGGTVYIETNEFEIDNVIGNFTLTQKAKGGVGGVGHDGYSITISSQVGQLAGPGLQSGNGGAINIVASQGGSGSGSIPGHVGTISIGAFDGSYNIGMFNSSIITEANNGVTMSTTDGTGLMQVNPGVAYIGTTIDGYVSSIQMFGNYPNPNDSIITINCASVPGNHAQIDMQIDGASAINITGTGVKISSLAGHGTGLISVDNTGLLSVASALDFAGDLAGSTTMDQYVASISGSGGTGGTVPINADILQFSQYQLTPSILQAPLPDLTVGAGADGYQLVIQGQAGQNTSASGEDGGVGGAVLISSGVGGTAIGGGSDGAPGAVFIGDASTNYVHVLPSVNEVQLSAGVGIFLNAASNFLSLTANGVINGSALSLKNTQVGTTAYTVDSGAVKDYYILCHDSTAATTITLPAATNGRTLVIKDTAGTAATHHITVTPVGGSTIDGASSYVINLNYGAIVLTAFQQSELTGNWFVVGEYNGTVI